MYIMAKIIVSYHQAYAKACICAICLYLTNALTP